MPPPPPPPPPMATSEATCKKMVLFNVMTLHVLIIKAHANGRNKSQHCCMLLGFFCQQCCVHLHGPKSLTGFKSSIHNKCQHCLHGTTTMLALVYSLKPVKLLGPCKRTQHCWQKNPNNTHKGPCKQTQHCWQTTQCCVRLHGPLCVLLANNVVSVCMGL